MSHGVWCIHDSLLCVLACALFRLVPTFCACVASGICIVLSSCLRLVLQAISWICKRMRCSRKDSTSPPPPLPRKQQCCRIWASQSRCRTRRDTFLRLRGNKFSFFVYVSVFYWVARAGSGSMANAISCLELFFQLGVIDCKPMEYLDFFSFALALVLFLFFFN